jgi:hypothetical protein
VSAETRAVVDTETGEYITSLLPGDKIMHREIIDRLQLEDANKMIFAPETWGKAYDGAIGKLARLKLTAAEYRIILLMLPLIRACSGLVAYGNYKPVQIDYIISELGMTRKTANTSLQRLIDLRVMSRAESGHDYIIVFNPYIYNRGRLINKTLYEMFKRSSWAKCKSG